MGKSNSTNDTCEKPLPRIPVEKRLFRNLKRAHDSLHVKAYKLFKPYKITMGQFDLMETILLSPDKALSIQEIALCTVSLQPNVTRSVGKLEKANLVSCTKSSNDNRTVMVTLTEEGTRLISRIQKPLLELHISQFKNFEYDELISFNNFVKRIFQK